MQIIKIFVTLMATVLLLTACQRDHSYYYLMTHPMLLKEAEGQCQANSSATAYCERVQRAWDDFMALLSEQQADPEKFGQRIMDQQAVYAKAKSAWRAAKVAVEALQGKESTASQMRMAQAKVVDTKQALQKARESVSILLAVVGVESPE